MDAKDYLQFNLTIRLGSLLSLPSKLIHRLRRIDDMLNHDLEFQSKTISMTTFAQESGSLTSMPAPTPVRLPFELVAMPGPLAFLTSGYAVGLIAMALLLNRIQHIVVPSRRSLAYRFMRRRRSVLHALFYTFLPIDLSSTAYRFVLRIPSLYFLFKNIILFLTIILQVFNLFPSLTMFPWMESLGQWASQKKMADVCWSTFGAVCLALVVGALTRGLEGPNTANTSPFNLFGYSMLLHIYSVPATHVTSGLLSRPDINVLIALFLPLLQLTMIHSLGVKKRWARYRLVPTSICAFLNIIHFNYALLTRPASYPLLNYLPCLLETMLLLVTVVTIGLNILTQILLEGQVTRSLFGHARSLTPRWDEDFAIVLLRLGTASLEATNVAGFGNELGSVTVGDFLEADSRTGNPAKANSPDESLVELSRAGALAMPRSGHRRGDKVIKAGFANEIKKVKVKKEGDDWLMDHTWLRELVRFGLSLLAFVRGCYRVMLWAVWYKWRGYRLVYRNGATRSDVTIGVNHQSVRTQIETKRMNEGDSAYARFLMGEAVSDDEDEYFPSPDGISASSVESETASDDGADEDEEGDDHGTGTEAAGLYSDLLVDSASSAVAPGPVLLAHMTSSTDSPLTRRRYDQLLVGPQRRKSPSRERSRFKDDWLDVVQSRRRSIPRSGLSDASLSDGRMLCVICTVEPREIICWPCRCLALCNDCRENLASRYSASRHNCPCCRRGVEGYSKIYIP